MDSILEAIPDVEKKYSEKYAIVDKCDSQYNKNDTLIANARDILEDQLKEIDVSLKKLENVSPLDYPSEPGQDNKNFVKKISDIRQAGLEEREKLDKIKTDLNNNQDRLTTLI